MEEISTSFCFICLLHLANEKGLKLQSRNDTEAAMEEGGDVDSEMVADKKVGNIWELTVRHA